MSRTKKSFFVTSCSNFDDGLVSGDAFLLEICICFFRSYINCIVIKKNSKTIDRCDSTYKYIIIFFIIWFSENWTIFSIYSSENICAFKTFRTKIIQLEKQIWSLRIILYIRMRSNFSIPKLWFQKQNTQSTVTFYNTKTKWNKCSCTRKQAVDVFLFATLWI